MRRILLFGILAAIVLVGCSASARYRFKHWFFDIPDETSEPAAEGSPAAVPAAPQATAPQPEVRFVSLHPPYVNRECTTCHDSEKRMRPFENFIEVCSDCHDEYFGDEIEHFPVADGECLLCHDMHRSRLKSLLKKPMPDLCVACHDEPEDLSEDAHNGGEGVDDCTRCHNPHFGEAPFLKEGIKP